MEQANEIQETLGRSYAVPDEIDEADLEAGTSPVPHSPVTYLMMFLELDALALEAEEEGPSYLADLDKVPDFIDEPPVAVGEVCDTHFRLPKHQLLWLEQTPVREEAIKAT